jgi:UDP-N-acetylmuramoyl-L-alanyl-D-glutamate--2,6-diaminopimelate ligase
MLMLKELLTAAEILDSRNAADVPVADLAYHSAQVVPGSLFVCIRGYKTDGHKYLEQAAARGAAAAIVEEFQEAARLPQFRVANSRKALAALADRFCGHPSRKLKVLGVTATNGKTTTTFMTNAVLEKHGLKTGLIGTVIVKVGDTFTPAALTTPESLDLHRILAQAVKEGVSHVTMECSSSGLELYRSGSVEFDIVAVNNISREHIDLHGSFEKYFDAKARLVREASPEQWAIFNLDCPYSASLVTETRARPVTYGVKESAGDLRVRDLDLSTGRAAFTVELCRDLQVGDTLYTPQKFPIRLSVLGLHSVYNAMVAVIAGLLCGVPIPTIQEALQKFRGVERRFELIFEDDYLILDDHFANSGNIDVTLETLKFMNYRSLQIVYAIRGSRGVIVNRENAEALARWAPRLGVAEVIATCSRSHTDEKDFVTPEEVAVYREVMAAAGVQTVVHEELPAALADGLARLQAGDVMLMAGCQGMDHGARLVLEQIYQKSPHRSREEIFEALQNRVAGM